MKVLDIQEQLDMGLSKKQIVDKMEDHDADNDGIDEEYDFV